MASASHHARRVFRAHVNRLVMYAYSHMLSIRWSLEVALPLCETLKIKVTLSRWQQASPEFLLSTVALVSPFLLLAVRPVAGTGVSPFLLLSVPPLDRSPR